MHLKEKMGWNERSFEGTGGVGRRVHWKEKEGVGGMCNAHCALEGKGRNFEAC